VPSYSAQGKVNLQYDKMGHFAQVHLAQFFNLDCALFKTATAFTYNYFGCSYCAMAKSKKSSSSCTVCKKRF